MMHYHLERANVLRRWESRDDHVFPAPFLIGPHPGYQPREHVPRARHVILLPWQSITQHDIELQRVRLLQQLLGKENKGLF